MFGNPVACSKCVARDTETFRGDRNEGETSGSLEQQLPEREWAALAREEFCLGISKKEEL